MSIAIAPNVPPQDIDAEESVLGAMLMSETAADEVAATLEPRDFYREAHGTVFRAVLQLQSRSEPVDVITVTDQLVTMGKLEEVGGRPYVHGLADSVPAAANARRYATIVRELAQLRRLIAAGTEIAQRGYERSGPVRELIDEAEARIFQVSQQGAEVGQLRAISDLLKEEFERIERLTAEDKDITGAPSGLRDLDRLTSGFQPSNLIILAARPSMGKTSLALGMARHLRVDAGVPVAIFSLEMSHSEITQRLMCAEGHVDSMRLRTGRMQGDDWPRLAEACDRLNRAPIYIDDSAGIGVMEIRSKARRLKSREPGLGLILIDYLQLMSGHAENRVQEISQISRSLKLLARDLDVPVVALSQLSRAVESRPDKRPVLSDLRESGCLAGEARVHLADEGRDVPIRDLVGRTGFRVLALDRSTWRLEPRTVTNAFATGRKPVWRLTTRLGRTIRATANHKFLAFDGWRRLDDIAVGMRLALPRRLATGAQPSMSDAELALLGHLIGDGCTPPRHTIQYTSVDEHLARAVAGLATDVFGWSVRPRVVAERRWFQTYLPAAECLGKGRRNPVAAWLDELGAFGLRSWQQHVPAKVFEQPAAGVAVFLRHLWSTDGCLRAGGAYPVIRYDSSSERLSRDVQSLLLRLGINARLRHVSTGSKGRPSYRVDVTGREDALRFLEVVPAVGSAKQAQALAIQAELVAVGADTNRDVIPRDVWRSTVVPALATAGADGGRLSTRAFPAALGGAYCGSTLYGQDPGRDRAARVASAARSAELTARATSDVYWDEVLSIEPDGEDEVYDLTVDGLANFVADDIVVHNSIEQDADMVMFIYRDEYYNKEAEDNKGLAELIVAKHRNGATGKVDLLFRQRYTLFSDLSREGY